MKAISSLISVILILMIGISLVSSMYIFFTEVIATSTDAGTETAEHISSSLMAEMKIDSLTTAGIVTIKNTGKVQLTNFNVFVNGAMEATSSITIMPGDSDDIDVGPLLTGDIVKVTSSEGAAAISSVP
ncbi:MAG: hypothetical protein ABIE55_03205 [Candidatus Aenigmatarchaeota archaeon]